MLRRIHSITRHEAKERGNASLMYLLMFTMLAGLMGFGIDTALGTYTANNLKDAANTATVAAATQTTWSGSKKSIHKNNARKRFDQIYGDMRKAYPNVTKKGNYKVTSFKVSKSRAGAPNNTVSVRLTEKSNTLFLHMFGTDEFNYTIESTARLGSLYEKK